MNRKVVLKPLFSTNPIGMMDGMTKTPKGRTRKTGWIQTLPLTKVLSLYRAKRHRKDASTKWTLARKYMRKILSPHRVRRVHSRYILYQTSLQAQNVRAFNDGPLRSLLLSLPPPCMSYAHGHLHAALTYHLHPYIIPPPISLISHPSSIYE